MTTSSEAAPAPSSHAILRRLLTIIAISKDAALVVLRMLHLIHTCVAAFFNNCLRPLPVPPNFGWFVRWRLYFHYLGRRWSRADSFVIILPFEYPVLLLRACHH